MREFEVKKIYNSITNIQDEMIEEAQTVKLKRKGRSPLGSCAIAACLCLAAGASLWLIAHRTKIERFVYPGEITEIGSLEEITSSYDGNLLAETLVASGARTTSIRLLYAKGGEVSDPDAWDALFITGDYNGQDFTLACRFDGEAAKQDPAETYAVTQYGNVKVTIYRAESDWRTDTDILFLYRARFTLDGVTYDLSTHSNDPEDIYAYLNLILGEPEDNANQSDAILTDVLGFDTCRVEMREISRHQYLWHYYVEMDGKEMCVAEQFGYHDGPEAWSRDLDGDGVPELICNCTYGDGVQSVIVYRNNNGIIEEGSIRWSYYEDKIGWTHVGMGGVSSYPAERYDPEQGVITATDYYTRGYDDPVTVEIDSGLEPFDFSPFRHTKDE